MGGGPLGAACAGAVGNNEGDAAAMKKAVDDSKKERRDAAPLVGFATTESSSVSPLSCSDASCLGVADGAYTEVADSRACRDAAVVDEPDVVQASDDSRQEAATITKSSERKRKALGLCWV